MRLIAALAIAGGVYVLVSPARPVHIAVPSGTRVVPAAIAGLVGVFVGLPPLVGAIVGLAVFSGSTAVQRVRVARTSAAARDLWPDFLALVRSRIGSGEPLPDAVRVAGRSLGGGFRRLDRAWGGSFVTEIARARTDWSDPVADRVLTTLQVAATTGGSHVDAVLSALATSLSDEMQIRAAHEAALTQQRLTAGVALVSPWVILALSAATNPQAGAEFSTPTGRLVLVVGAVATGAGYLLARRAARLSAQPRIFG